MPIQAYGPDGKLWTAIADGGWRNDVGARMTDEQMEKFMDNAVPGMGLASTGDQRVENADAVMLAQTIAESIAKQGVDFDNLGDNESILIFTESATINLVEVSEAVLAAGAPPPNGLLESAREVERLLKFAFEDGAIPEETVLGLTVDPYGMLADLRAAIAAAASQSPPSDHQSDQAHSQDVVVP